MSSATLGALELAMLLSVSRLGDDAFGLAIRRDLTARLGHDYSVGAVYTTLDRLAAKGLVSSRKTDPLPVRGGRARKLFAVTTAGRAAIRQADRVTQSLWAGVGLTLSPGLR